MNREIKQYDGVEVEFRAVFIEGRTSSVLVQFREQKNLVQLYESQFRPLTEQEKADTGLPVEAYDSLGYPTLTVVRKW